MNIQIAPIAKEHVEEFHSALDVVAREKRYLALVSAPPLRETRKFVLANIGQRNPQYVALDRGRVIGWCDVVRSPRQTAHHSGVLGMALLPEYRYRGIGKRLIETVLDAAWAVEFTRIELTVREDNATAIALYRKLGFEDEGLRRNAYRIDGRYESVLAMALIKEDPA